MLLALVATALLGALSPHARGQSFGGSVASKIGFDQKLDAQVPLDIPLKDEAGKPVRLGDFFGERPVILTLVYHECPMLCNEVLNALTRGLKGLTFDVGDQFEVVTVSINPAETPELAAAKKAGYLKRYGRPGAERGWHFLTGDEGSIRRLAQSVGFRYVYMPESKQYAHAAGIVLLTPRGRVARYFFGISYAPRDLRLGLTEASAGKIGSPDRPDAPLLLPVRPDDRQVYLRHHERPAPARHRDGPGAGGLRRRRCSGASGGGGGRSRTPPTTMAARGPMVLNTSLQPPESHVERPPLPRAGLDHRGEGRCALLRPARHDLLLHRPDLRPAPLSSASSTAGDRRPTGATPSRPTTRSRRSGSASRW